MRFLKLQLIFHVITALTIDRFGRRFLLLVSSSGMSEYFNAPFSMEKKTPKFPLGVPLRVSPEASEGSHCCVSLPERTFRGFLLSSKNGA